MHALPLWAQLGILALLLLVSALFSMVETAMMALNRHRLKHLVSLNKLGAKNTQKLLGQTDRLLSMLLIVNSLINTIIPVFTTSLALDWFGKERWILSLTTGVVAFFIIVFSEITPKILGASYPEKIALPASLIIEPLIYVSRPIINLTRFFATLILRLLGIRTLQEQESRLSMEELRTLMLESSRFMRSKHHSMLLNLFDLENISVDDVMVPRNQIEALNWKDNFETILQKIDTCYHNRLPVYEGEVDQILGILHLRRLLPALRGRDLSREHLQELISPAYFIPSGALAFEQLQHFQSQRQRMGLVVNEYGEVEGLVTPEDIIEEFIGEFTTTLQPDQRALRWSARQDCILAGSTPLRELNRALNLKLPAKGPKTLNGLVLETLQDIPEGAVCLEIAHCRLEILQIEHQGIKTLRLWQAPSQDAPAE